MSMSLASSLQDLCSYLSSWSRRVRVNDPTEMYRRSHCRLRSGSHESTESYRGDEDKDDEEERDGAKCLL